MGTAHVAHGASGGSVAAALSLVAMWFAMMAVMMAPVAWPWIAAFRRVHLHAPTSNRTAATAAFVGGYGIAWLLFSIAAAIVQRVLMLTSGLDASRGLLPSAVGGVVLVGAGLVQFTSFKRACLTHCRNPFSFLLARWQDGPVSAWRIGFGHGVFCVGCCWALMATTLAVGTMNMWWMLAIAVATFAEQVTRRGDLVRVAIGSILVAAGCGQFT